jgi:hypothetical protein
MAELRHSQTQQLGGISINPYTNMLLLHVRGTVVVADAHDYLKL